MAAVRRLVLDVLKPHDPPLVEFAAAVGDVDGVDSAAATVLERDDEVQTVEIELDGEAVDVDVVRDRIESLGATVHSVDHVTCGDPPRSD